MRVRAHAAIWVADRLAVHVKQVRGMTYVTLPGGRVNDHESVIAALRREVREELNIDVEIGRLLFCAEILSAVNRQEIELLFEAFPAGPVDERQFELVDPANPHVDVLPPVLSQLADLRSGGQAGLWLGNIYDSRIKEH